MDICSSWDYAIANGLIPMGIKGFILDYREATFDIGISESARIAEYYKEPLDIFGEYKIAIVTTSMKDVVTPTLVAMKDDGYFSRPFFNMKGAIKWVLQ